MGFRDLLDAVGTLEIGEHTKEGGSVVPLFVFTFGEPAQGEVLDLQAKAQTDAALPDGVTEKDVPKMPKEEQARLARGMSSLSTGAVRATVTAIQVKGEDPEPIAPGSMDERLAGRLIRSVRRHVPNGEQNPLVERALALCGLGTKNAEGEDDADPTKASAQDSTPGTSP